jgi:hypothetical protein
MRPSEIRVSSAVGGAVGLAHDAAATRAVLKLRHPGFRSRNRISLKSLPSEVSWEEEFRSKRRTSAASVDNAGICPEITRPRRARANESDENAGV